MDQFIKLLKHAESSPGSCALSSPTARASDCEYEFQSTFKLSDLSDFHGSIPDFEKVSGTDDRFRCDATPAIRFVVEAKADLLDAAYAALPVQVRSRLPRSAVGTKLPHSLALCAEPLLRSRSEPFGLNDLLAIKDEDAKSVLAQLIVHILALHVVSRELLLKSDAALPTLRIMEGSRVGDVVQSVVQGQPCLSVIVDIDQDYGSSGTYVNIHTAVLGLSVVRQGTKFTWQVRSNVLTMRRRTKAAGVCLPVTESQFNELSNAAAPLVHRLLEALASPTCVQLRENTVFIQKRPRSGEAPVPVSGRAILDNKGFMLNQLSHGQDVAFYEMAEEALESATPAELTAILPTFAACLSPMVAAYSLRYRKWGFVALTSCEDVAYREGLMDKLVVAESVKSLLLSLTDCFTQDGIRRGTDFVADKSGGNVFLLHGPSGIGKTLTAEATAESLKRPLYRVASAELGTTPEEINTNLERMLENSKRWGAVTLLDEADIFLEARTSDNITRNAIVGIFLQTLEYSSGVLFVTTNRVNNLDEAILPRISLGFSYPELSLEAKATVWKNILDLNEHAVTSDCIALLAAYPFNGRQIKNVVNMAATLAASKNATLSLEHLLPMANATREFVEICAKGKAANAPMHPRTA